MLLFNSFIPTDQNLLPFDGQVNYYGVIFSNEEINHLYTILDSEIEWENDQISLFGKTIVTKRKVAFYGSTNITYNYSNTSKKAKPWSTTLLSIKEKVESITGQKFNACLLNLYHNGTEGMSWHQDNEKELSPNSTIASLSLGAERKFYFKHIRTGTQVKINLENGSLLTMKDETQSFWLHSLPLQKKIISPRINLTFRTFTE